MEIAAQLYTVREFTKTEAGVRETFRKVKEMGYDSVQISAFGFYEPDKIRAMLDETELTVCATHTPLDRTRPTRSSPSISCSAANTSDSAGCAPTIWPDTRRSSTGSRPQ